MAGTGELYQIWPDKIKLNEDGLPCPRVVIANLKNMDGNPKRMICQDLHSGKGLCLRLQNISADNFKSSGNYEAYKRIINTKNTWACFVIPHDNKVIGSVSLRFEKSYSVTDYTVEIIEKLINKAAPILIAVRAQDELKVFSDELSTFSKRLIHEIKSPVATLKSAADELLENPENVGKISKSIIREANFVNFLIENVRVVEDLMKFSVAAVTKKPAAEISYIISLYADHLSIDDKTLTFTEDGFPSELAIDPNAFRLIIANLVSNAVKYTLPGGKINITHKTEGNYLHILFEDDGIGILEGEKDMIFEKYKIGSNTAHVKAESTGLGLATAFKILKLFLGDVTVINCSNTTQIELKLFITKEKEAEGKKNA
ncbi:MAG: HAMP domain-containing histidine kinase [Nitrospirae bacterium]|nr:HAMP domain-containing histidine kinase [Nitrospirota bacterium]